MHNDPEAMRRLAEVALAEDTLPDESAKNGSTAGGPAMRQPRKGTPWYFGMQCHVG